MTRVTAFSFPGTGVAEDDYRVAFLYLYGAMFTIGHSGERREGLTLATGAENHNLLGRNIHGFIGIDEKVIVHMQVSEVTGDLGVGEHTTAGNRNASASCSGCVTDLLDTVYMA